MSFGCDLILPALLSFQHFIAFYDLDISVYQVINSVASIDFYDLDISIYQVINSVANIDFYDLDISNFR